MNIKILHQFISFVEHNFKSTGTLIYSKIKDGWVTRGITCMFSLTYK